MNDNILLSEDFSSFNTGELPYDKFHTAAGEYHFIAPNGYTNGWVDNVVNYNYRGASWIITSRNGKKYIEQMRLPFVTMHPHKIHPTISKGETYWKDYYACVTARMLNTHLGGECGLCFAMKNAMNTFVFAMNDNSLVLVYRHKEHEEILAQCSYNVSSDLYVKLAVKINKNKIICFCDDAEVFNYTTEFSLTGRIALTATVPAQFTDILVKCSETTYKDMQEDEEKRIISVNLLSEKQPKMKLYKKINISPYGTSRQIRFGHLLGDGKMQIVIAQYQKRIMRDAYCSICCLTAIDLDGNVLWTRGEPYDCSGDNIISCDVPLQLYDINGDGLDEVITAEDFKILILNGKTGEVLKSALTPVSDDADDSILGLPWNVYAFDRINPDGIRICNFRGLKEPRDILIKDRYSRIYALDDNLSLMWKYHATKNTGHFPYALDVNKDGKDELFCGYDLIDSNGKLIWTLETKNDHTDEIVPGRFLRDRNTGAFALASGSEGFIIATYDGKIIKQDKIGHAQRVSIGNYIPEKEGLQICVTNFWGHENIIYMYDCEGNEIWEEERPVNGNLLTPVNWNGDGSDLILLNANAKDGGLMDGNGNIVVRFPDDGHPDLCAEAIDLTGDSRDEIVVWDEKQMWIYTQNDNPKGNVYNPVKYQLYNASNYRGEFHYPDSSWL